MELKNSKRVRQNIYQCYYYNCRNPVDGPIVVPASAAPGIDVDQIWNEGSDGHNDTGLNL